MTIQDLSISRVIITIRNFKFKEILDLRLELNSRRRNELYFLLVLNAIPSAVDTRQRYMVFGMPWRVSCVPPSFQFASLESLLVTVTTFEVPEK